jgi:hypothetical protein
MFFAIAATIINIVVRSRTTDGVAYNVAVDSVTGAAIGCDCPAGRHNCQCWHLEAAELRPAWVKAADFLARHTGGKDAVLERFAIVAESEGVLDAIKATIRQAEGLRAHRGAEAETQRHEARVQPDAPAASCECSRCGGEGEIPQFRHVEGGICFKCRGSGKEARVAC